jgi:hypothetical protein
MARTGFVLPTLLTTNYVVLTAVVSITGSDGAAPAMGDAIIGETVERAMRPIIRSDGNSLHPDQPCRTRFDLIVIWRWPSRRGIG